MGERLQGETRGRTERGRATALPAVGALLALVALGLLGPGPLAAQATGDAEPATVELPAELDRVLRDYETAWRAGDPDGLAALFTEDGFVLSSRRPPVRGREAIRERYAGSGGPLFLRAWAWATEGDVGWIVGGFAATEEMAAMGKFTLTLRRGPDGRWLISSDMDNGS